MRHHAFLLSTLAASATAQRCDSPSPDIECSAVPEIAAYRTTSCTPTHIFLTRGTDEPYPGRLGNITSLVCTALGGDSQCGYEDVSYPAANRYISATSWCESAATGVRNGQTQLKEYVARCPASKVVLMGFSQGATVTQDLLGGGGGPLFDLCTQEANKGLDRGQAPGTKAVVTFGTVRRSPSEPYSVGAGKDFQPEALRDGELKVGIDQYAGVLRDYCNEGDQYCAKSSSPLALENHLKYFVQYQQDVVDWVVKTVKGSKI
ncbi:alpha/beta-hydrolase [Paraphaeosphaeria sporulosa]|uniref:Alpha/beta-hydrolase n=1 Tax=Paraphaeosphaeria sporulosa TaxID=1460663 RepID=A0A177CLI0_9PLEO|nr:alpha/beta-hydrolase [Paraphaeosphaeria sporulosa]OAG07710.1 alpha/beta-hydrolase [Paraphaeosphaeria sporulosa]